MRVIKLLWKIMRTGIVMVSLVGLLMAAGCATTRPMETVDQVDIDRFMGDWFVIAHIPAFVEADAYNAVESYERVDEDTIQTTYTFREGGFDGEKEVMKPVGTIKNSDSNAEWGMQFIWPIQAEYLITYIDDDYSTTIVSRSKRDYVWIMARMPQIPDAEYEKLVAIVEAQGYDMSELRKVPQQWEGKPGY